VCVYVNILLRRRDGAESLRDNERGERRRSALYTIHSRVRLYILYYILQQWPYGTSVINALLCV